ncbi:prolyl oligopeptidase family serine peptidase [Sphingopyxis sp. KK2]|uniref:prolyl oligopeptidase family serine peptidase n=1 Tax=Sphingopyxis sp. KK2 TaxID=1855727 RepID=UPI00097E5721|nr:prolyl oligopeptidase family serine peptidase [Sphingopyxis sp. KK2]
MTKYLAAALMLAAGAPAMAQTLTNATDRPPAEAFSETQYGETVDDPYRWMESGERAKDVEAFIRQSSAHTVGQLAKLPGRAKLRERIAAGVQAGVRYGDLNEAGGRLFYRRTDPGAQLPKLVMRGPDGAEKILYDPEAGGTKGPALSSYSVSPDGKTLAMHTAAGGAEVGTIRFIDVASGKELPDKLEPVWGEFEAQWVDNSTVTYTRMAATDGDDAMQNMRVYLHKLGQADGPALLGAGVAGTPTFDPREFPFISYVEGSDWAVGYGGGARADGRVMIAKRADIAAGKPAWREIAQYDDRILTGALYGDTLYLVRTGTAPNGEVVALDLKAGATLAQAKTVLPAGDAVIAEIAAADDGLYVLAQTDGISRLFFVGKDGKPVESKLPIQGNAVGLESAGPGGVTFALQDWFTAAEWMRAKDGKVSPLGLASASYKGVAGARQVRETATSADGTKVPLAILLPPGYKSGPAPVLLEGYASYGVNTAEPYYAQWMFGLLESGGVVGYCGARGGGERGRSWHEAGRSANKPNAHADLIACGERMVELGLTTPKQMTVIGTSAGGLLAPPAALKRPDLFGGLIANVAVLNPTRLAFAENGANQFAEMGDPTTAEGFKALSLADSYRLLLAAKDIPNTLITVGLNDRRVEPWFSGKFAGRALDRFGKTRLILIRTDPDAGHGIGSARDQLVEQFADVYSFVLHQAGAPGFE